MEGRRTNAARDSFAGMSAGHYENFPVASMLMPARLRPAVQAIYRFARCADDIADEGDDAPQARFDKLDALARELDAIDAGRSNAWPDLARAVERHRLPTDLLRDLLSAFRQDVAVARYDTHAAVLDYCRRSANPIGRLLLHLFDRADPPLTVLSDAICTGLQLTNFLQDVALDWRKGRVYLPLDALRGHGLDERAIANAAANTRWRTLMREQTSSVRALLQSGAPLAHALGGRIGWELRLVVQGGLRILERIDAVDGDVFRSRPKLKTWDWLVMATRAARMRARQQGALPSLPTRTSDR
jgi:squalene synthase HpnC